MSEKLSIIIPCFNSEKTLEEAVGSCYVQNITIPFEIVLVDDASTDNTRMIMKMLRDKHPEIIIAYHDQNRGGGATRNTAVKNSSGSIIFCLDSDDILPNGTLGKMLDFMQAKKCDGVGIHRSIKFKGSNVHDIEAVHTFGYVDQKVPFESLLQNDNIYCPLYSTFMITKRAFNDIGGYPENHGFDTQGLAWRFLSFGLIAYTCPDTEYLHRVHFTESYYLREATAGKVNYNWQDLLSEHEYLFTEETKKFITSFNCKDFTKNLFDELKKKDNVFKPNYAELLGTVKFVNEQNITHPDRVYIKRNSFNGIIIRIRERIKKNTTLYQIFFHLIVIKNNIIKLFSERKSRKEYYKQIQLIIQSKKIILDVPFAGIGDSLAFSTLPRLLKETYGVDFYISRESVTRYRNPDAYKIIFEMNPYVKGVSNHYDIFKPKTFICEESIWTFFTDWNCKNVIERVEKQFGLEITGLPEIYYKPNLIDEYKNTILIDKNFITGKRLGWKYKDNVFEQEANKYLDKNDKIEYVDTKRQDLFKYVDMIYSCKRFVGTFSGGSALAACFKKQFSVIWPTNGINGSNYQFRFKKSTGCYLK